MRLTISHRNTTPSLQHLLSDFEQDSCVFLSCQFVCLTLNIRCLSKIPRHDKLIQAVRRASRNAGLGLHPAHEVTYDHDRMDFEIFIPDAEHLVIDFSVTHPLSPSYIRAAQRSAGAIRLAERRKFHRYKD